MSNVSETSRKVRRSELHTWGWRPVTGITSQSELLELARSLGRPVPSPTGELVKELTPRMSVDARRSTLSHTYAKGPFPLHTDTAFWPVPSKYIVLRARGDIRRTTTILTFADLFREGTADFYPSVERSIWLMRAPSKSFYCSMRFQSGGETGWRYDGQCMSPANDAAAEVKKTLGSMLTHSRVNTIHWTGDLAVVICNWEVLHGRGPSPPNEKDRVLERIYVE